jgi:hypothetical protein
MKRKEFLGYIAKSAGFVFVSANFPAAKYLLDGQKEVKGTVTSNGKAVQGVVVSDGYTVVQTDKKGRFEIEPDTASKAIFISTPAGYAFTNQNGISRHYTLTKDLAADKRINFELQPLDKDDNDHQFIIWADPQVKNDKDVQKMMTYSVPDTQKIIAAAGAGALMHGITVGDIVWDNHALYADYDRAVSKMNIPFFQCLGNHDMDLNNGGDENSDITFHQNYGPTYYSFNRGQAHYVVMDNVRYLGKDKEYDGFVQQNQLDWLKKDLSFVSKDKLIVLSLHIPVHNGTKNKEDLYALLEDRNVHIMSGHTHYHQNNIRENIFEHNHGTVCGAWWTGPICCDGTPNGYGVYKVSGKDLTWHYQSTGEAADHQMEIFVNTYNDTQKQVVVNIWNHDPAWKTEYWIDEVSHGALEQYEGYDPTAYKNLQGPELPKARSFAEPSLTNHLFKALIPAASKTVKVTATDRFGKVYSSSYKI